MSIQIPLSQAFLLDHKASGLSRFESALRFFLAKIGGAGNTDLNFVYGFHGQGRLGRRSI